MRGERRREGENGGEIDASRAARWGISNKKCNYW